MIIDDLLDMYALGCFPMANSRQADSFSFFAPHIRALLPIDNLHVPKRLRRTVRQHKFTIKIDTDFAQVINNCANTHETTWINDAIINLYCELNAIGIAHSVEVWDSDTMVGGLYGVAIGGTFCGESMFSHITDASKIALVHLCARLKSGGFKLLDSQFRNPHLDQFNLYEIPQDEYVRKMQNLLNINANFVQNDYDEIECVEDFLFSNYSRSK